ncbi:MAG: hypothetical protein ACTS73_08605 [Arsenophonus sp. NEOnobi-MAG3]
MPLITPLMICWQGFLEKYHAAMKKLEKDCEELLAFYDFPSSHTSLCVK